MPHPAIIDPPSSDLPNLTLVRILWLDYSGLRRCKLVPPATLSTPPQIPLSALSHISSGASTLISTESKHPHPNLLLLSPKITSCNTPPTPFRLPWNPTQGILLAALHSSDGTPAPYCPRACLSRAIAVLARLGLVAHVQLSLEFQLCHAFSADGLSAATPLGGPNGQVCSHDLTDAAAPFLDELADGFRALDIDVQAMYIGSAPGQVVVWLSNKTVMNAVDNIVIARETVRAIARRHELVASFAPKLRGGAGNGMMVQLSLEGHFGTGERWQGQQLGVDSTGRSFMAGVLAGLPWVSCLLNATPESYERVLPGVGVGAYQVWGVDNDEAAVRLREDGGSFEVNVGDAVSNAHMGMAALLAAGAVGVTDEMELPEAWDVDPHSMDENVRPSLLPESVEEAIMCFEMVQGDDIVTEVFPKEMAQNIVRVRREEMVFASKIGSAAYEKFIGTLH